MVWVCNPATGKVGTGASLRLLSTSLTKWTDSWSVRDPISKYQMDNSWSQPLASICMCTYTCGHMYVCMQAFRHTRHTNTYTHRERTRASEWTSEREREQGYLPIFPYFIFLLCSYTVPIIYKAVYYDWNKEVIYPLRRIPDIKHCFLQKVKLQSLPLSVNWNYRFLSKERNNNVTEIHCIPWCHVELYSSPQWNQKKDIWQTKVINISQENIISAVQIWQGYWKWWKTEKSSKIKDARDKICLLRARLYLRLDLKHRKDISEMTGKNPNTVSRFVGSVY